MSEFKVSEDPLTGKLKLNIGRRRILLEKVDDYLYRAYVSAKTLMKKKFSELPLYEKNGEAVIIEYMPYTRLKKEYLYERRGLSLLDEATLWRDNERGRVYAEVLIQTWSYAYKAWMPLDIYAWIISTVAKKLGFEAEANREEQSMIIEIEKSYPLDTPIRIALLEIKELDSEIKALIEKIESRVKKTVVNTISKMMGVDRETILAILEEPEEKISTKP